MRNRYIRFFISSTFADMAKERNVLQKLFSRLNKEFSQKGWQIESVDLRWGISQEAGFDNKTMQICKSEIRRCQQLSPRPNFIVLLGNRYGWTPLPETIPYNVGKLLKMSGTEKDLFNRWYHLDENALPSGEYVLQERKEQYRDAVTWFDEVEYPLSQMFNENAESFRWKIWKFANRSEHEITKLFGESATAQEINIGVLSVPDAKDHVIAYIRDLADIPAPQEKVFLEKGENTIQKLEKLKDDLRQKLQKENILDISTNYSTYSTEKYDIDFEHEIEKKIRRVIENAIAEYESTTATTEDEIHMSIAAEEAKDFVGREKELSDIHQYIIDPNERRPLWIKGASGSGKSALLAKVIELHRNTQHIVCRFCGRTANTLYSGDLDFISNSWAFDKYFKERGKPTLIVLDALNQLNDKNDLRFASLEWLDKKHLKDIKIIVSTTDELKYSQQPPFLKIYMLPSMGTDSVPFVTSILNKAGRTLTKSQYASLQSVIDASDSSAIYLHILGHYLKTKASWEQIEDNCSDIVYLVDNYLKHLTLPERHGQELVGEALGLLTKERIGLSDKEMLDLLSQNKYVRNAVEANSFHQIETQEGEWRLPSVLWSRLRYELSPFFRTYASPAGQVTTIFHDELKTIFTAIYLYEPAQKGDIASQLFHYYKEHIHQGNTHALLEIVHSAIVKEATENEMPLIQEAVDFLSSDLDFLLEKHRMFPQQLNSDFDEVLPFIEGEMRKKTVSLKLSLSSLPAKASNDQLLLYMYSLPTDTLLYQLAKDRVDSKAAMKNVISDSEPEDPTLYVLNEVGEFPCMSDDGTKVASVFDNRHTIRITDAVNPHKSIELVSDGEVIELQCDDKMNYLAIRFKGQCQVFDIAQGKEICLKHFGEHGWMSLSVDGKTFAFGDVSTCQVYKMSEIDGIFKEYISTDSMEGYVKPLAGRLSPSGNIIWLLLNNQGLIRCDIENDCEYSFKIDFYHKGKPLVGDLYDPYTSILSCTETRFVCYHDQEAIVGTCDGKSYVYWGRDYIWSPSYGRNPIMVISRDGSYLLDHGGEDGWLLLCTIDKFCEGSSSLLAPVCRSPIDGFCAINSNFSIGLNCSQKQIFDMSLRLKRYTHSYNLWYRELHSFSCSSNGIEAVLSSGKGGGERKKDIIRISNLRRYTWQPPFNTDNYVSAEIAVISPNSDYMVLSVNNNQTESMAIIRLDNNEVICEKEFEASFLNKVIVSPDSRYIIYYEDRHLNTKEAKVNAVTIINNIGDELSRYLLPSPQNVRWLHKGRIKKQFISMDSRYLYTIFSCGDDARETGCIEEGAYEVIDLISLKYIEIEGHADFPVTMYFIDGCLGIPFYFTLPVPGNPFLSNEIERNLICFFNPGKANMRCSNMDEYNIIGGSCTGRFVMSINRKHDLYIQQNFRGASDFQNGLVLERIQRVIPALDEAHIYAITDNFEILLYNLVSRKIEQRAYRGAFYQYQVCARGLYLLNDKGDLALFQPDAQYKVNVPAVTTFVRRWNLKTKQQEEPTAVCPMCGHMFGLDEALKDVLKEGQDMDIYKYISHSDWDNPELKGHACPHCGAQLQFNPYII